MYSLRLAVIAVLVTATIKPSFGQIDTTSGPLAYGGGLVVGASLDAGHIAVFEGSDACGAFDGGWSLGVLAAFRVHYALTSRLALCGSLGWTFDRSSFTAAPVGRQLIYDAVSDALVDVDREYRLTAFTNAINATFGAGWCPISRWEFALEAIASLRIGGSSTVTDAVLGPGDVAFDDGSRQHELARSSVPAPGLSIGAGLVVRRRIDIGRGWALYPRLDLSDVEAATDRGDAWSTRRVGVGLDVMFDRPVRITQPATPADVPPQRARLSTPTATRHNLHEFA